MPSRPTALASACASWIIVALLLTSCAAMAPSPPPKPVLRVPVSAGDLAAQMAVEEFASRFPGVALQLDAGVGSPIDAWAQKLCAPTEGLGRVAAKEVLAGAVPKTVYVLAEITAREAAEASVFRSAMKAAGVRVALSTVVHKGERDFSPALNRAAVDQPELILFAGKPDAAARFLQQLKGRRLDIPLLVADTHRQGSVIAGATTLTAVPPLALSPEAASFVTAYQAKAGRVPQWSAACTYDATRAWLLAAALARSARGGALPSGDEVEAERMAVNFAGATGPVAFTGQGQRQSQAYALLKLGPGGPERIKAITAQGG
ncbi:hypothetical protein BURK2_02876 [Burkholderiales bacterium]|nr:MAG: ABC transporter substrate-binding protein [Burkholderiales bacterium]CAG0999173.1 hypothetical protein BURK2_02876 [Burkholderiales bacterium]